MQSTEDVLREILEELRKPKMFVESAPGLVQLRNAIVLAGLATSQHVPRGIAEEAAQQLKELAFTLGLVRRPQ